MPSTPPQQKQLSAFAALSVCAVFFLSGASALILEIAWTRQLELLLGNSVYAATTMIAVYMLGLGAGSRIGGALARRKASPLRIYAILELLIVAWALAVPFLLAALNALFPALAGIPALHSPAGTPTLLRFFVSVAVFGVPTLLMGATLPLLTRAIAGRARGFATRFSFLYGGNTLGAVAGALAAGFVLLPRFGVTKTILLAITLNLVAAAGAFFLSVILRPKAVSKDISSPPGERAEAAALTLPSSLLTFLAAAAGFLSLYFEVFWFRTLVLVFGSTTYSLAAMLAVFLTGTALGPLLIGWLGDRGETAKRIPMIVGLCFFAAGVAIVFPLNLIGRLPDRFLADLSASNFSWNQLITSKFIHSAQLILAPAIFLGAVLPLCAKGFRAIAGAGPGETAPGAVAAARVYLANTFGAAAGAILGGFVLLPYTGLYHGLLGGGAACILVALACVFPLGYAPRLRLLLPVLTVFLALVWYVFNEPWDRSKFALGAYFHPGAHSEAGRVRFGEVLETSSLLVYEEGIAATVSVLESHENTLRYMSNGKVEADTNIRAMMNQRLLGHLPMLLHPGEPRRVMNIGLGAGITVGAMGCYPGLSTIDTLEIEPAVRLAADAFSEYNHDVLRHPSLSIYYNDARNFLLTSRENYDVICSDPFEPVVAGAIHLFTREHFTLARRRLADDGIFCQWIPMYELSLEDYTALVGTFVSVFPQTLYFSTGADSILIGFNDRVRIDPAKAARRLLIPEVAASLADIGFTKPEHLWGILIADFSSSPPRRPERLITDDDPFVEFTAPRSALEQTHHHNRRLQLDFFEEGREKRLNSPFMAAFSEEERGAIESQQTALQDALRAGLEFAQGNMQLALDHAAEAIERAPENPIVRDEVSEIYSTVGNSVLKLGDHGRAIELLRKANEYQPDVFKHLYRLALAYLRSGESAQAAEILAAGIKQFPDSPFFYSLHGSLSLEAGNMREALAFHQIAVEKAPRLAHLWDQYERAAQIGGDEALLSKIQNQKRDRTE